MKLSIFSSKSYDRQWLSKADNHAGYELVFHSASLSNETVSLAEGASAVCAFVNDSLSASVLEKLHGYGVKAVLLRCAGYNNVDLAKAEELGLFVANVPSYSPEAVAEFAVALVQTLNRNTHRAYNRVRYCL